MENIRRRDRNRRGFTLLELLVVMVILVLLAGVVTIVVVKRVEEARHAKAISDIESIGNALDQFYLHTGRYPATDEGLEALRVKPQSDVNGWNGPYVKRSIPADPWGREYAYECPGSNNADSYDLSSMGRDGREGGSGSDADITNWDK
ncbi:MAG: type II secretion system major pseudopilin GspG [bacterium]|nr:type II secretion system major pseudopilin GspG [bacterium]MDD3805580.1 type II secretion system major pseudopilin GspG [bacterium]MDD4557904.1 type II secretion system major pseudopilin GspG [bacterium]